MDSKELKGFSIDHTITDLQAGTNYILTLQDQNVLDMQEDDDVLENIDLQQSFQQRIAAKRKLKLLQHTNSKLMPVEEDDWAEGKRILSKYDDDGAVETEKKKK